MKAENGWVGLHYALTCPPYPSYYMDITPHKLSDEYFLVISRGKALNTAAALLPALTQHPSPEG